MQILVYLLVYFKTQRDFWSAFFFVVAVLDLYSKPIFVLLNGNPMLGDFEDLLFGIHCTKNTAIYQIFVLTSLWNLCFAFQIHFLNACLWVSAYYLITAMAFNKSIHPCGMIYNKIKVELLDSGCLNHGNLRKD